MTIEYFVHMDAIFLFTWKIFGLCGKNIFQKLCVVHNSLFTFTRSHDSCVGQTHKNSPMTKGRNRSIK